MHKIHVLKLITAIFLPIAIGAFGGWITSQAIPDWYEQLKKPIFNPPMWLFGPVWTILYFLMGFSFYLIWKQEPSSSRNVALWLFAIQLLLNLGWTILFFNFHWIGLAFVEIIILWVVIFAMFIQFYPLNIIAAYLNLPYLLWISFAAILNGSIYFLNR